MLKECNLLILKANYGTYIDLHLVHNAQTFYLCMTNSDAKKVATMRYQSENVVTSPLTRKLNDLMSVRFKMKVSSVNGYLPAPAANFFK